MAAKDYRWCTGLTAALTMEDASRGSVANFTTPATSQWQTLESPKDSLGEPTIYIPFGQELFV
eukprot:1072552-Amphidinium_carterae.1